MAFAYSEEIQIYYDDRGMGEPVILCLPGFTNEHTIFAPLVERLVQTIVCWLWTCADMANLKHPIGTLDLLRWPLMPSPSSKIAVHNPLFPTPKASFHGWPSNCGSACASGCQR